MEKETFVSEKERAVQEYKKLREIMGARAGHFVTQEQFFDLVERAENLLKLPHLLAGEQLQWIQLMQDALSDIGGPKNKFSEESNEERKRLGLEPGIVMKTTYPMKFGF
jgi:hypothetical protein